jgi:ATP-dependent DNA ligase
VQATQWTVRPVEARRRSWHTVDHALAAALHIKPQLAQLTRDAPEGDAWLHEIKLDGYRMHMRLDRGRVQLLTRRANDWTAKYPTIAEAIARLPAQNATARFAACCQMGIPPST